MPTANADPEGEGYAVADIFRRIYGVNSTYIPITVTSGNANDPTISDMILQQTGIFFVGGIRQNIVYTLLNEGEDTLAMTAIRQVLRAGGVIAGTSAGMGSLVSKCLHLFNLINIKKHNIQEDFSKCQLFHNAHAFFTRPKLT